MADSKALAEARALARQFLENPDYQRTLRLRLLAGEVAPALEVMLWNYAYGKPVESVEVKSIEKDYDSLTLEELRDELKDLDAQIALMTRKGTSDDDEVKRRERAIH